MYKLKINMCTQALSTFKTKLLNLKRLKEARKNQIFK